MPQALADGKPGIIAIMDNDDFHFDILTGNADGVHRTKVMHLQPVEYEKMNANCSSGIKKN